MDLEIAQFAAVADLIGIVHTQLRINIEIADVQRKQLALGLIAQHMDQSRVCGQELPIGRGAEDALEGIVEQLPVERLGLLQGLLCRPSLADIFDQRLETRLPLDLKLCQSQQGIV